MNSQEIKDLILFCKKENVVHFKTPDFEMVFHPSAFVEAKEPTGGHKEVASDEELLFLSSN